MDENIKRNLMNAVVHGTIKNVQSFFNEYKLEMDDSFFDYELLKAALQRNSLGILKILLKIGCRAVNPNKSESEEGLLHIAIKNVRSFTDDIVKKLVEKGASIYDKNLKGETTVYAAYKQNNFEAARAFLMNSDPNSKSLNNDDLLHFHIACVLNEPYFAKKYLLAGIDQNCLISLDSKECADLNPIQFAIKKDYFNLFEILVKYNSDLSIKNKAGLTPLQMLYYSNHIKNRKSWIEKIFNKQNKEFVNSEDKFRVSRFHLCCMLNKPDYVEEFIAKGVNVNSSISLNCPVKPGFTALHFAVKSGCEEVIKLLLKNGANPNKLDRRRRTPLHLACEKSDKLKRNIIQILVKYKACPVIVNQNGSTPLHDSFYYKNCEEMNIFDILISNLEWESNNITDLHGLSLFHIVCTTSNTNQVIEFLNSGVDINSCVSSGIYSGFTALHFAVMYNQKNVVKILLKKNANVNVKDKSGVTPLHLACEFNYMKFDRHKCISNWAEFMYYPAVADFTKARSNQLKIIKLLLLHGSNVNAEDASGITPLIHACMIDKNYFILDWTYLTYTFTKERDGLINEISIRLKDIIEILISNGANAKSRTCTQQSILHLVSKYSTLKILDNSIRILIASGVDVNAVDEDGLTPLHVAVMHSNKMMVRRLLKFKADPNIKSKNSRVPLHIVIKRITEGIDVRKTIEEDIINALLEYGADVNIRDSCGTVMLHSVRYKDSLIESLLYYGADINMQSFSGETSVTELLEWKQGQSWMIRVYGKLFQIIYKHVQKLLALGLPVSREVKEACNKIYPIYNEEYKTVDEYMGLKSLENIFDDCVNELDRLKDTKIDSYTTLYDILLKDSHELAKYIKNDEVVKLIKVENVDTKFPLYGFLLKLQFNRGLKRSEVLESAEAALERALNVRLPNLCYNIVLKNLTNEEVNNLKKVPPVKRNLKRKLRENDKNQAKPESKLQKKEQDPQRMMILKLRRVDE